ncbi:PREDICTED: pleckstrin homology domain-containing family A member 6 [Corvus brachyrhynchos]|uniref:pleckstrin homology domain-containing family A member 6 n=1 Tax=Corvus brachyrhynchos TaxID=85066 RepID=UPI000816428A|nr:PREDICTED: pleckstrin homology domain-containing family A member 6 [Corvus brachyrhynchos]
MTVSTGLGGKSSASAGCGRATGSASGAAGGGDARWHRHNERRNTFLHPVTGQLPEDTSRLDLPKQSSDMSSKAGSKRPGTGPREPPHVTVCWVQEPPAGNGPSLSPHAAHAARVQTPPTQRHEKPDSENIPPSKHHHHQHCNAAHREQPKAEPDAKTRGEGDGRGSEKMERKPPERPDGKKEPLAKANGLAGPEPPSEPGSPYPEGPRGPASAERPAQPNGWPYPSPSRPGSTAFPAGGDGDSGAQRRGVTPRSHPEKVAQRKSSMTQLQQWVNSRRATGPPEELRSPTRFYPVSRRVPDYYSPYSPQYPEEYQYYPPGVRPDSICSMPAFDRVSPPWAPEEHPGGPLSPQYDYLGDRRPVPAGVYPYHFPASPTIHDKMDELLDLQLQRNLEYLDQQMSESETLITMVNRMVETSSPRAQLYMQVTPFPEAYRDTLHPYKISEQDTDKLLGKLCEQNKVLREQERLVQQLRAEKESLESALMGTHQELEMFGSQPAYPEKLLHKKESLQNQLINIRVELSQASTALANSTAEYESLESEVSTLHDDLWEQLNLDIQNEMLNRQIQKEIWRIQDVMEGLRKNNPSRGTDTAKHRVALGPSGTYSSNSPASPLSSASLTSPLSPFSLISGSQGSPTKPGPGEEPGPPRPPLPKSYVPLESPPAVPPLPSESRLWPYPASPSWHQGGGEAKRGQPKPGFEQSKKEPPRPSLPGPAPEGLPQSQTEQDGDKQAALNKVGIVPPRTKSPAEDEVVSRRNGLANGLSSRVGLGWRGWAGLGGLGEPRGALLQLGDRSVWLCDSVCHHPSPGDPHPGRDTPGVTPQEGVDISDLEAALRSDEPGKVYETPQEEMARLRKMELEPQHYDVDINKELSTPDKVLIPERYVELEPESPLSPEEMKEKQKKVERIKTLIAKSSLPNVIPLGEGEVDTPQDPEMQLQEQEKRIEISCALAAEASRRGRMLSAQCATPSPPTSPASPTPPTNPLSSEPPRAADSSHLMRV